MLVTGEKSSWAQNEIQDAFEMLHGKSCILTFGFGVYTSGGLIEVTHSHAPVAACCNARLPTNICRVVWPLCHGQVGVALVAYTVCFNIG